MTSDRRKHAGLRTAFLIAASLASALGGEWVLGEEPVGEIASVTVTANRWEERAEDVPMAISVTTADLADRVGATDPDSFAPLVPGLMFNRLANVSIPFLRGVGSPAGESGDEPSVAYYIDDIYIPAGVGSYANFNNIERIEVLKGPQGTVFGRNATGGVVQVYTRNPSPEGAFDVTAGVANYSTTSGSLYATGALTDTLAVNLSLDGTKQNDGWGRYVVSGASAFTGWEYGGRTKLQWTPNEATSVLLTADHDRLRSEQGLNFRAFPGTGSLNPTPPFPNGGFAPPAGYYDNNQNLDSHTITRQSGLSLKVTSVLGPTRFVSITGWRFTKAVNGLDEDAGPLPLVNATVNTAEQTWTQEFRLSSLTGARTQWLIGAFYYKDTAGYTPLHLYGLAFQPLPFLDAFGRETTDSWAGFAQAKREVLPATNLTVGVRYTSDHRRLDAGGVFGGGPEIPAPNSPRSATWSKVTDRVALDHHFMQDLMAYVAYNRGFKSGLFNPIVLPGSPIDPPVAPEVLDAYTLGAKSELLDHRLRVDAEAFYYKDKNIQLDQIVAGTTHITNAASATIKGVDLDITMIPLAGLTISVSVEGLTGHYDSFSNGLFYVYNPVVGGNCAFTGAGSCAGAVLPPNYDRATGTWNLKGNHTVNTPPLSSSLIVDYQIPLGVGLCDLTSSWTHTGHYYADADNGLGQVSPSSPNNDRQQLVDLLNASIGWTSADRAWQARVWGKNLVGLQYWSYVAETSFLTQYTAAPPRTFGLTVTRLW